MAGPFGYPQGFTESVSAVTSTNSVQLGERRWEGGCEYVYMYNMSTSTIGVGYGVVQSAASAFSMTLSSITGDKCFGVVKNAQIGPTQYGWICVKGVTQVQLTDSAVANHTAATGAGINLVSDGTFMGITNGDDFISTGTTGLTWSIMDCGTTLESIATNSAGAAYVHCYG